MYAHKSAANILLFFDMCKRACIFLWKKVSFCLAYSKKLLYLRTPPWVRQFPRKYSRVLLSIYKDERFFSFRVVPPLPDNRKPSSLTNRGIPRYPHGTKAFYYREITFRQEKKIALILAYVQFLLYLCTRNGLKNRILLI